MGQAQTVDVDAMAYNLLLCDREQGYLLPSLWEWLAERDLAWFIVDAVGQMDPSRRTGKHQAHGESPDQRRSTLFCTAQKPRTRCLWDRLIAEEK